MNKIASVVSDDKTDKATKTSVRLALTEQLRDAFDLIRNTRYPFMKEDEILKLALSKLYANDCMEAGKGTQVSLLLAKIRNKRPDFGKDWLKSKSLKEEDVNPHLFCDMIVDLLSD